MLNQRNIVTLLFALVILGTTAFNFVSLINNGLTTTNIGGLIIVAINIGLLGLHLRGWMAASRILVLIFTASFITAVSEPYLTRQFPSAMFLPPLIAMVVATPTWVGATGLLLYAGMLIRSGGQGVFIQPNEMLIYLMCIGTMVLARTMSDRFLQVALEQRAKTEAALREATARSAELAESNQQLDAQIAEQRQLLDLISVLETPALALAEGVLVVPLMGHIDPRRAQALTERLLQTVAEQRARLVVLDIAGVAVLDTGVAHALTQTVQAIRLLGCEVVLSGISASVAMTLTQLNINLKGVTTVRNPQEGMRLALNEPNKRSGSAAQPTPFAGQGHETPGTRHGSGSI